MEGYLSVEDYCKLEHISADTAYHRANRNHVENFKDPNTGYLYIYWSDKNRVVPDGFVSMTQFMKLHHMSRNNVHVLIYKGFISKDDIFMQDCGLTNKRIYIRKDAKILNAIEYNRPEGYITCKEFAKKV